MKCLCISDTPSSPEADPTTREAQQALRRPLITVSRVPSMSDPRASIAGEPSADPGASYLGLRSASLLGASSTEDDRRFSNVTCVSSLSPSYRSLRGSDASSVALTTEQGANLLQLCGQQQQQQQQQQTQLQQNLLMPPTTQLMPWLQLRFDYDTTTIRLRRIARACFHSTRFDANKNDHINFFVVLVSQSNRTHIVISITSVVIEYVVVSSYRSRVVVESQLWYRL